MNQILSQLLPQIPLQFGAQFRVDAIDSASGGFSGAEVFRLETSAGSFCLRAWPHDSLPIDRIRGLHRLLGHIHTEGVTEVAVPRRTTHGDTLLFHSGQPWQLEPWMPGTADFHDRGTPERVLSAFQCLARWHSAAKSFRATASESQWFRSKKSASSPAVTERLRLMRDWSISRDLDSLEVKTHRLPEKHAELCVRALAAFRKDVASLLASLQMSQSIRVELQPCIRDVWHDHLLFTGDRLTGLIDCNATRMESVASDLARLTGSMFGDDHLAKDAALSAYESVRRLRPEERMLIPILDRSGVALSAMHWVRRILNHDSEFDDDSVWNRLSGFVSRMEHLD